jgi:MinD-like ATPase involved in chromosome partitioning or flagellar assembly
MSERDEPTVGFGALTTGIHGRPESNPVAAPSNHVPEAPGFDVEAGGRVASVPAREIFMPETPEALTSERLLRRLPGAPSSGWRRALYRLSFGAVNLGEPAEVLERRRLENEVRARITGRTRFVAVVARKGGVGKTTTATLLGMTLAQLRDDRVVALDGNPDRGTLADRVPRQTTATVWDVVAGATNGTVRTFAEMSQLVSRDTTRLDVIASEIDPRKARAFRDDDYKHVIGLLSQYYTAVITDCGTDFTHDLMPAILNAADAVVVVAGASLDEARLGSETLDMIASLGHPELAAQAVVAVQSASQTPVNVAEVTKHFATRARRVVRIPRDEHLAEGAVVDLDRLAPATRRAALELTAAVVAGIDDAHAPNPTKEIH